MILEGVSLSKAEGVGSNECSGPHSRCDEGELGCIVRHGWGQSGKPGDPDQVKM